MKHFFVLIKRKIRSFFGYTGGYSKDNKQTYFEIPELGIRGRRPGTDLVTRLQGMDFLLGRAKGYSVLDAGCAEGLIAREFYRHGAVCVHGLDLQDVSVTTAQKLLLQEPNGAYYFGQADLLKWDETVTTNTHLLPSYDIVLLLSVYGHIVRKDRNAADSALAALASMTRRFFAVRSTAVIPENLILEKGFDIVYRDPAPDANELIVFGRTH